jgi:SAM-dependent methyltransferase
MTTRDLCGSCAGERLEVFLDLGKTPLANRFPATATEAEVVYPLQLARCLNCGLVQQVEIVPDEAIYGEDYGYFSGASEAQRDYHAAFAAMILDQEMTADPLREGLIVEIACNDGTLMDHFVDAGLRVVGVDPSGPAKLAQDAGLDVIRQPFTAALARTMRETDGPASLVIANNVLAHVNDLSDMLTGIWELLADDGMAVVEVQYLPDLLTGNMIDQVYHEHRYHWSLSAFRHAAGLRGLHVVDAQLIELQGGGLRVWLSRDARYAPASSLSPRAQSILERERGFRGPAAYDSMQPRVERVRKHLRDLVASERLAGRTIAGFGASAKATTILNYCDLGPWIEYVLDSTPYKQGRFIPGTKTPIVAAGYQSPAGRHADTHLMLVPNYLGYLLRHHPGTRWLVPLPTPVII